jgi:hypothetical protein
MVVAAQALNQTGQRQGHAIHLRGICFRHHGNSQRPLLCRKIINLELVASVSVHFSIFAAFDNKMMTRLFSDMKLLCHAIFILAR